MMKMENRGFYCWKLFVVCTFAYSESTLVILIFQNQDLVTHAQGPNSSDFSMFPGACSWETTFFSNNLSWLKFPKCWISVSISFATWSSFKFLKLKMNPKVIASYVSQSVLLLSKKKVLNHSHGIFFKIDKKSECSLFGQNIRLKLRLRYVTMTLLLKTYAFPYRPVRAGGVSNLPMALNINIHN